MRLRFLSRYRQVHQRSTLRRTRKDDLSTHQLRALAHGDQADAALAWAFRESSPVIFHFQLEGSRQETKADPSPFCASVTRDVVQRFLQNAVHMHASAAIDGERLPLLFIGYGNSRLPFHGRNVPV